MQLRYEQTATSYFNIPGNIIAYWASKGYVNAFTKFSKMRNHYEMDSGIKTGNNELFLKLWFEVPNLSLCQHPTLRDLYEGNYKWFKYNKGGGYRKWYGGYEHVINLKSNAKDIRDRISKDTYRLRNSEKYFKKSIIWPLIGDIRFSARYMNDDTLSDVASNVIVLDDDFDYGLLSIMNSKVFNEMLKFINSTVSYPIDSIASVPIKLSISDSAKKLGEDNVSIVKNDWDSFETSWDFKKHPLI